MGFIRKALFVGTGGLSGAAGIKANSKKERTAKALERQNRILSQGDGETTGGLRAALQTPAKPMRMITTPKGRRNAKKPPVD